MKALIMAFSVLATLLIVSTAAAAAEAPGEYDLFIALSPAVAILIAGAMGFFGIILGHALNTRSAGRRDDRLRAAEARTLSIALRAEVLALKLSLESNHKFYGRALDGRKQLYRAFLDFFAIHDHPVFDAATAKLGLLGGDLAKTVVHFYAAIGALNHKLKLIEGMGVPRPLDPDDDEDKEMLDGMGQAVEDANQLAGELEAFADKKQNTD